MCVARGPLSIGFCGACGAIGGFVASFSYFMAKIGGAIGGAIGGPWPRSVGPGWAPAQFGVGPGWALCPIRGGAGAGVRWGRARGRLARWVGPSYAHWGRCEVYLATRLRGTGAGAGGWVVGLVVIRARNVGGPVSGPGAGLPLLL